MLTRHRRGQGAPRSSAEAPQGKKKRVGITGSRQANKIGRRRAKRAKKQALRRPIRLMNIFSSSHQIWPEGQENFSGGHQNRPAIDRQPPSTTGTAHAGTEECNRQSARRTTKASEKPAKNHKHRKKSQTECLRRRVSTSTAKQQYYPSPLQRVRIFKAKARARAKEQESQSHFKGWR